MNKIRTKETVIATQEENIILKFTLLGDENRYKIMAETDKECEIESCNDCGIKEAGRLFDIVSTNAVMPEILKDIISDIRFR